MRARTRWLLFVACCAAFLVVNAPAQAHMLKCKTAGKITAKKHRCHFRQHHHAVTALEWVENHTRVSIYSPNRAVRDRAWKGVEGHRWLKRAMKRRLTSWEMMQLPRYTTLMLCIHTGIKGGRYKLYGDFRYLGGGYRVHPTGEGSWRSYNGSGPYYGGLQMGDWYIDTFGGMMVRKYRTGDARRWRPLDQIIVGSRGIEKMGLGSIYGQFPRTGPPCL